MTDPDLLVEVVDDEIIITVPGSHYSVTYYKPEKSPQLLARRISDTDDRRIAMTLSEFLARALEASQRQGARAWVDCVGD